FSTICRPRQRKNPKSVSRSETSQSHQYILRRGPACRKEDEISKDTKGVNETKKGDFLPKSVSSPQA
ncbi:MAG: hypothetical protein IKI65_02270, partial [Firmicutes bacterium]|nr:hypothetical protein [Bacillota bacterium]